MILDLAKRLSKVDEDLSLKISFNGSLIELTVTNNSIGELYCYSCNDVSEAYNKVNEFVDCLKDPEKFDKLMSNILEVALEM